VGVSIVLVGERKISGEKPQIFRKSPINRITVTGWNQSNEYILQTCREEIWQLPTTLQEKLYGPVDTLQKTTRFVAKTEIQV
jgi:hypothetical protein